MSDLVKQAITEWFGERCDDYAKGCAACDAWAEHDAMESRIVQLERELDARMATEALAVSELAAEKALADEISVGLNVALDIIEAASKRLTGKSGAKWGIWYIDRISELRAAYRKARGM